MGDPRHPGGDGGGASELELDWGDRRSARAEVPAPALPPEPVAAPPPPARWTLDEEDSAIEVQLRRFAIPAALAVAWLLAQTGMGRFVERIFSGMWLHELGHAITAWFCGYFAVPGPWRTAIADERSFLVVLLLAGGFGYLGLRLRAAERPRWWLAPAALLVVQLIGTLVLRPSRAQALVTFGGDAGAMLLGAALMMTFYARRDGQLRKGWLRWGFLVLGAMAFMDIAPTWWDAISDVDAIPFGMIEGVGTSDPTRLTDDFGWSIRGMVRAHVAISVVALGLIVAAYLRGLWRKEDV